MFTVSSKHKIFPFRLVTIYSDQLWQKHDQDQQCFFTVFRRNEKAILVLKYFFPPSPLKDAFTWN